MNNLDYRVKWISNKDHPDQGISSEVPQMCLELQKSTLYPHTTYTDNPHTS